MSTEPARNVEIKAQLAGGADGFQRRVDIARRLTGSEGELIRQRDVFFRAEKGRLKLRYLETKKSELIQYFRPDVGGPKLSTYHKLDLDEPQLMEKILAESVGVRGEVRKTRHLFMHGQTRVHLDDVEGLGYFLEFEVVLMPEQTLEEGTAIADELMKAYEIETGDLIEGAYMDKLEK
ncbi:hypothetical protein quinque_015472 [Culex quinquefasciatus]